jgi:hypothetical protein
VNFLVSEDDIVDGGGAEEVLLLESELFTGISGVIWIEDTGNVLGILSLTNGTVVVTGVESVEIEAISWLGFPESQVVCVVGVETWNWGIISNGNNLLAAFPLRSNSGSILPTIGLTVEPDVIGNILSLDFPRVS